MLKTPADNRVASSPKRRSRKPERKLQMQIKTNHHFRDVLYWHDLTEAEQGELSDSYDSVEESTFFRYRNHVYDLGEFLSARGSGFRLFPNWDGYHNDSFFSAVLVKYSDCGDAVKVGFALS